METSPAAHALILAVDDDPAVGRALERDLRHRYGARHRVVLADSGAAGLGAVEQIVRRGEPVALLVADQRMPGMSGVEFLARALRIAPEAKRVLLTAYAETDAAIQAINELRLDHYLMKPWSPPETHLYPVLDDLLEDWEADSAARLAEPGLRLVGHRFSAEASARRDFLARNGVPYRWLDAAAPEARALMAAVGLDERDVPFLVLEDGETLVRPSQSAIAERIGLRTHANLPFYDLVILGGGPAGLAAAVYGASEGLKTLLVEQHAAGGQAGQSSRIENYLGFPSGLSGADLARRATAQARRLGAEMLTAREAVALRENGPARVVTLAGGEEIGSHSVLIATGVHYSRLDAPGVAALTGSGVYYGAAPDAAEVEGEDVAVVGAANSAGQAAIELATKARTVTILCRGDGLETSMSHYLVEQLRSLPNVEVRTHAVVAAASGDGRLEELTIAAGGREEGMAVTRAFVFIGAKPLTVWLDGTVALDPAGFIVSGPSLLRIDGRHRWRLDRDPFPLETSLPGVFVAGDVRDQSIKRVASAVGEGSMAVQLVHQYLGGLVPAGASSAPAERALAPGAGGIVVDRLREAPILAALEDEELERVVALGRERRLAAGEFLFREGDGASAFHVVLEGELETTRGVAGEQVPMMSHAPGGYLGAMALLTETAYRGSTRALVDALLFELDGDDFRKLALTHPSLLREFVLPAIENVSGKIKGVERDREKFLEIGKLAAGLAHGLNNPAAAAVRDVAILRDYERQRQAAFAEIAGGGVPAEQLAALAALGAAATEQAVPGERLDPLARSDRERELVETLGRRGIADAAEIASALTEAGLGDGWVDRVAACVGDAGLAPGLRFVGACAGARVLLAELEEATTHIADLVDDFRSFSYLDRAPRQTVDINGDLENTLSLLGPKLRDKQIEIVRDLDPGLPGVEASGSELNQVWTNLIDNAIDAMGPGGRLTLCTRLQGERVCVEVGDDGPGIPPDLRARIFDAFFTTKPVGQGTGLGLDIAQRIVAGHRGELSVQSEPGDTRFRVLLPLR
jgi:thioredoxin reductase (NADPH)